MFTQDADLLAIGARWQAGNQDFPGIVFAPQLGVGIGALIDDLELIATCMTDDEIGKAGLVPSASIISAGICDRSPAPLTIPVASHLPHGGQANGRNQVDIRSMFFQEDAARLRFGAARKTLPLRERDLTLAMQVAVQIVIVVLLALLALVAPRHAGLLDGFEKRPLVGTTSVMCDAAIDDVWFDEGECTEVGGTSPCDVALAEAPILADTCYQYCRARVLGYDVILIDTIPN